jgi:glycosyltransferase involved in cell wall biosynthesis
MKILQILNPVIPLPAKTIGGTERIVEYIIEELLQRGHDVTLMGHNDSIVPANVKFIPIGTYLDQKDTIQIIWKHLMFNNYDVIHNHGRLIYFLPKIWAKTKKVHTFHMVNLATKSFFRFLACRPKNLILSPCAKWIQEKYNKYPANWQFVNNGIPLKKYTFKECKINDASPMSIICRIAEPKGVLDAIEIAKKTNKNLIIAGIGGTYPHEVEWFNNVFLKLCDGNQIKYIGPVNDSQKQNLLEISCCLLMLTIETEAFNLTMLEANACGCPVLSYNRYFPPDFIKEGVNGFIGNNQDELIEKVKLLTQIDRAKCRNEFEEHYTSAIMTKNYLKLYIA